MIADIEPQDASKKYLKWSSTDINVATVSAEGLISGIAPGTANIILETQNGQSDICKINVIKLTSFNISKEVDVVNELAFAFDKYDNLWYGEAGGLYKMGKDGLGSKFYPLNAQVNAIEFDSKNNLWASTFSNGLLKFDGKTWSSYDTKNSEIPSTDLKTVAVDHNDNIWVGLGKNNMLGGGVARFDGVSWDTFNVEDGLVYGYVFKIIEDQQNNVWFGTWKGLSMFDGSEWKSYLNDESDFRGIYDMDVDKENKIWCVSGFHVFKYDGISMIDYPIEIYGVAAIGIDDKDNKWFGNTEGVSKFDGTEWFQVTFENFDIFDVRGITIDSEGNKWFLSARKIYKLED